jgi:hypothetical protein
MAKIINGRMTAEHEGDLVVFVIGMRINKFWKFHKWMPVAFAMQPMIKELMANPNSGFLGSMGVFPFMVQYWRSFDDLTNYARTRDANHFPAWVKFNKRVGQSGDVGIFHESYLVKAGEMETIYNNMPRMGVGKFTTLVPAVGSKLTARTRSKKDEQDRAPITPTGEIVK